ncbi:MAG: DUF928 domain-containing protein [Cyanobacteria bacterium J06592_8]
MVIKAFPVLGLVAGLLSPTASSFALPLQTPLNSQPQMQISLEFPPSPNREGAQSSAGGGRRGQDLENRVCTTGDIPLTALKPNEDEAEITVSAHPDFFIFVPENTAEEAEFVIVNEDNDEVYLKTFDLSKEAGVVQVSLPKTVMLEVGQTYKWQFVVWCSSDDPSQIEFVEGEIQRTELSEDLETQINATDDPLEQAQLFATEGIWQDTVMIVAKLRESNQAEWEQLLTSVGLDAMIASAPLKPCCIEEEATSSELEN